MRSMMSAGFAVFLVIPSHLSGRRGLILLPDEHKRALPLQNNGSCVGVPQPSLARR